MMRRWFPVLLCIIAFGTTFAASASFEEQLAQAPKCALTCALNLLSTTSCSLSNATCVCNDVGYNDAVGQCVLANCTVRDALETQNVIASACERPVHTQAPVILGIAIAFLVPSLVVCLIRLIIRVKRIGWLGMDDIFIFLAVALSIPTTAAGIVLADAGLGRDLWGVDVNNIDKIFYWYFIAELCYICTTSLTKMSVLCFYLRVFPNKSLRRNTYITLAVTAAAFVAFFFSAMFQCVPISATWKGWDGEHPGKCISAKGLIYAQAITNIVLDIPTFLIPLPALKELALPRARKLGLIFVFLLGILTTIICILRFQGLVRFSLTSKNFTWNLGPTAYWSFLEINIGVLRVCLPTIRPFFRAISHNLCGTPANTGYSKYEMPDRPSRLARLDRKAEDDTAVASSRPSRPDMKSESIELAEMLREEGHTGFAVQATRPLDPL